jgi:RimJ/RimL family protein N-acetyltransferase
VSPPDRSAPPTGPRLADAVTTLRPLRRGDADALVRYGSDPQMRRWTTVPQPYTPRDAESFLAMAADGWNSRSIFHFAVTASGDDRLAGVLDLRPKGAGMAEIGFGLLPEMRGRGLMSHGVRLLAGWAFRDHDISVLHWLAHRGNWPSRRVAWSVGFRVGPALPGLIEHRGDRVEGWIAALRSGDPMRPAHPWFATARVAGAGVVLRPLRDDDRRRIVEAANDDQTHRWMAGKPLPYTDGDAAGHLNRVLEVQAQGRSVFWAFADPETDVMLGEVGVFGVSGRDLGHGQGEIGYWTHPDARGRGLTTEAVKLAARHSMIPLDDGGLGLRRLALRTAASNRASQQVAERAGFTRTGVDRRADEVDGELVDTVRYDLLEEEVPAP